MGHWWSCPESLHHLRKLEWTACFAPQTLEMSLWDHWSALELEQSPKKREKKRKEKQDALSPFFHPYCMYSYPQQTRHVTIYTPLHGWDVAEYHAMHQHSMNHISLNNMKNRLRKVTHCARHIPSNTRPHQWHWGDQEMGTTVCHAQNAVRCRVSNLKYESVHIDFKTVVFIRANPCK